MRRESVAASFSSFESGRWRWTAGAEVSHRDFRSVVPGVALTSSLVAKGYQLKQSAQLDVALWRSPERRLGSKVVFSGRAPVVAACSIFREVARIRSLQLVSPVPG